MPIASQIDALRTLLPASVRELGKNDARPIISPTTTEEASTALRFANTHNLSIEITGAGTKRSWPNPVAADLLLDTTRLTGIRQHSWQDLTATVAAGTPWSTLQQALAAHGQFIALDSLWPTRATVGGILAANDSGPLRLRYGSLRDLVIGMTIVLADGTIARSGGRVVKNVAGYDLHKLMIGAYGTLGLITEVTFRLHPLPLHASTFTVAAPTAAALAPLMQSIAASHLLTQSLQLRAVPEGNSVRSFHLDIQLNAHPDARQSETLTNMTASSGLTLNPSSDEVWLARETLLSQSNRILLKATMLPTELPAFAQEVLEKGGQCVAQSLGILHALFPTDAISIRLAEEFRYHINLQNGSTQLLTKTPGSAPAQTWDKSPSALQLMQELKRRFDPNRTLNPGALFGGI